jgi:hypothetical protein
MSKKFKFCCPAMELACGRASDNQRIGIQTGQLFMPKGGRLQVRTAVVIYFPKAKKGDESKYGFKSEFKNTVYGLCKWCPFCGARLEPEEENAEKPKAEAAAPRPSRKRNGRVARDGAEPSPVQPNNG